MAHKLTTDGDEVRIDGDLVELVERTPDGYKVTLLCPSGVRTIELTAREAGPLIRHLDSIARVIPTSDQEGGQP
jgi:hypothetical protein